MRGDAQNDGGHEGRAAGVGRVQEEAWGANPALSLSLCPAPLSLHWNAFPYATYDILHGHSATPPAARHPAKCARDCLCSLGGAERGGMKAYLKEGLAWLPSFLVTLDDWLFEL